MTQTQNRLISYLKEYCYGKSNAISKDRLAGIFDITTRELRDLKRDIVLNSDRNVGSTEKGYFYASSDLEIMQFRAYYMSRVRESLKMAKAYESEISQKDQLSII